MYENKFITTAFFLLMNIYSYNNNIKLSRSQCVSILNKAVTQNMIVNE